MGRGRPRKLWLVGGREMTIGEIVDATGKPHSTVSWQVRHGKAAEDVLSPDRLKPCRGTGMTYMAVRIPVDATEEEKRAIREVAAALRRKRAGGGDVR